MKNIGLYCAMVITTIVFFVVMVVMNEWLFSSLEFVRGVNWIYLPAGARLLCTLLFAGAGGVGLLIASWLVCFFYIFPDELARSSWGAVVAALAPYVMYRLARRWMGLGQALNHLTPSRLLILSVMYAFANAALHQIGCWLMGRGLHPDRLLILLVGDLLGTLIVLYGAKLVLRLLPARNNPYDLK